VNIPLEKGTDWKIYAVALEKAMMAVKDFECDVLIICFGGDTVIGDGDPSNLGGFCILPEEYVEMGKMISRSLPTKIPFLVTQEGGYRMDVIDTIVTNFLKGLLMKE